MQRSPLIAMSSVAAAAILLLSACSTNEVDESTAPASSATASASAESSASASASTDAPKASDTTEAATPSETPAENFAGADQLASASAVPLSQEDVVTTQDLYTSYQDVLSNIGTVEIVSEDDTSTEGEATSEESGLNKPNLALDEKTESSINAVATGGANDEFAATALEYANNGWTQEGKSTIVGEPKVTDTEFGGQPAKTLEVCVDSSDVVVKDSAGNTLTNSNVSHRSLNIFTLVEDNGTWKIASHDFPNNPDC